MNILYFINDIAVRNSQPEKCIVVNYLVDYRYKFDSLS